MASENIKSFNVNVLRAVAFLYGSHPAMVTIDHDTLDRTEEHADGSVTVDLPTGSEHGTIIWLRRNGIVDGDLIESNPMEGNQSAAIMNAQLTSRALRVLQKVDPNLGGIVGDAVVAGVNGPRESVVAERLMQLFLGI